MDVQDYINEECKRIKQDLLKEFEAIMNPLEAGLVSMLNDIQSLEKLCSRAHILDIIQKENVT